MKVTLLLLPFLLLGTSWESNSNLSSSSDNPNLVSIPLVQGWTSNRLKAPNDETRITKDTHHFASGRMGAILAKGGPSGMFAWAHLEGCHKGRTGTTKYKFLIAVKDESGYYYFVSNRSHLTIGADPWDGEARKHQWGQFAMPKEVLDAYKRGTKLKIEIISSRNYKDIGEQYAEKFGDLLNGRLSPEEILILLNQGKRN